MGLAEFLEVNQDWVAPVIEWGGLLFLLFITFSPFLIIRHRVFRPTRWWHIVGAYVFSIFTFLIFQLLFFGEYLKYFEGILRSGGVYKTYETAFIKFTNLHVFIYPILVFYSAKLLYKNLSKKVLLVSTIFAMGLFVISAAIVIYFVAYGLGQASYNF